MVGALGAHSLVAVPTSTHTGGAISAEFWLQTSPSQRWAHGAELCELCLREARGESSRQQRVGTNANGRE